MNWPRSLEKFRTVAPLIGGYAASVIAAWAAKKGFALSNTEAAAIVAGGGHVLSTVIAAAGVNPNGAAAPSMVRHEPIAPSPLSPLEIPDPFRPPLPPLPPRAPEVTAASERSPYAPYVPAELPKVGLDGLAQRPQEFRPESVRIDPPAFEPLMGSFAVDAPQADGAQMYDAVRREALDRARNISPQAVDAAMAALPPSDVIKAPRERRKRQPRITTQEPGAPMPETPTTGDGSQGFEP